MKLNHFVTILLLFPAMGFSQKIDTLQPKTFKPVVVTSYRNHQIEETSLNISKIDVDSMGLLGSYNLTEAIASEPGVEVLSSGNGISKPIIRGLSGNRVLVLMSGLKFDNQQWQEEHGLGLSSMGLSSVEVIKGPMSILYGSEAMGGVINLIEELPAPLNHSVFDVSTGINTNSLGGKLQLGYKTNNGKNWWRIRAGIDNYADYTDGNNQRIVNSRFDGYYLKTDYGFKKNNWVSNNHYMSSFNRFGFIFQDAYSFIEEDERWSRSMDVNPAHLVLLNILSSENTIYLDEKSNLSVNVGIQSNERMENEGGGAISLNMHLFTFQYLVKYTKQVSEKSNLIFSSLGSFENNTNFGARKIVPDANMQEANISAVVETKFNNGLSLENGWGIGEKYIQTKTTKNINDDTKELYPFRKIAPYYNFLSGLSYHSKSFSVKLNAATGSRAPNLAELSSDGLHEGIFTYEIGDPTLKNEYLFSGNTLFSVQNKWFKLSASPFYNYILDYIYLAPTTEQWFGFPVYRFKQKDTKQYGFEAGVSITPVKWLQFKATYTGMESRANNGEFTPYIPAQKAVASVNYTTELKDDQQLKAFVECEYFADQYHLATEEIGTPQYYLFNAAIIYSLKKDHFTLDLGLSGKNLLNESYYNHLSRFKSLGLLNQGRSIMLNAKISWIKKK
ncbi:TonB-dependent receptor [Paracrocinitomix mangrovi]|uniref:TonB-dependent receptor plug domain-containing protein n=1 Tax=Paracrocinitomix mangrovi TaxID=2862509 RepID=UPI001C8CF8B8|nr:TonB-dependent receptor [Paracrocinitomix mangrovi]UKN00625.1 TonB-dependent receptor [Paracrocinitomix mangrovi]